MALYDNLWLTTLDNVRLNRKLGVTETQDDAFLKEQIVKASAALIKTIGRVPLPYIDTRSHYVKPEKVTAKTLTLDEDLLALTTLTNADATSISTANTILEPLNEYPKRVIRLTEASGLQYQRGNIDDRIIVTGTWGYMPHYNTNAFIDSGVTVPAGQITTTIGTTITFTSGAGANFETGQYIRVNSEIMLITDADTNVLTIERGKLGTTAAAANTGDSLEIVKVLQVVQDVVTAEVAFRYKVRHQLGGSVTVFNGVTLQVVQRDPQMAALVASLRRLQVPVVV